MTTDSTPAAVLQRQLDAVLEEARSLRDDVQQAEKARKRGALISAGLLALVLIFMIGIVFIGYQSRQTADQLADCTTPGGTCYAEGQARQVQAISAVTQISIFVSQCGRLWPGEAGPDYDRKLERCVAERLTDAIKNPPMLGPPASPQPDPTPSPTASR